MNIQELKPSHYEQWLNLYQQYSKFYKVSLTKKSANNTWEWLMDLSHPCQGIVAQKDNLLIGLAHFRGMPSPLRGSETGFLDDLFTLKDYRGLKVATQLLQELKLIAQKNNWGIVRWITHDNNYQARYLYDKLAIKTDWNTYEMDVNLTKLV